MKIQIGENFREGGLQAGDDEFVLRFELATVTPVSQDGENILSCGMQVEVAALSGTIGLQAPEVVAAVDSSVGQGANDLAQFHRAVRVSHNPNTETPLTFGDRTVLTAVN